MERLRKLTFFSGNVPTTEELEHFKDARERVRLVIQARWAILGLLGAYGVYAYLFFRQSAEFFGLIRLHYAVPVAAFAFAVGYNAWYQYSCRWFSKIRALNQAQLLFDLLFVTVIVHYSGGAVSWFWAGTSTSSRPREPWPTAGCSPRSSTGS
jgi:hypothetical protein